MADPNSLMKKNARTLKYVKDYHLPMFQKLQHSDAFNQVKSYTKPVSTRTYLKWHVFRDRKTRKNHRNWIQNGKHGKSWKPAFSHHKNQKKYPKRSLFWKYFKAKFLIINLWLVKLLWKCGIGRPTLLISALLDIPKKTKQNNKTKQNKEIYKKSGSKFWCQMMCSEL